MRRIYESRAIARDDDDPFVPGERETYRPQAMRSISGSAWSKRLVPPWLRRRAISLSVSTPATAFPAGSNVPFVVTMKNSMPFPITIRTDSPLLWTWSVDGLPEASRVPVRDPPERPGALHFDRGERVRFRKRWSQMFRVSESEWEPAEPGEYTIGAAINVANPKLAGLCDETTVRIED